MLLTGLVVPIGVAVDPDDASYLTYFGTSPTLGEVLRLEIAPCS